MSLALYACSLFVVVIIGTVLIARVRIGHLEAELAQSRAENKEIKNGLARIHDEVLPTKAHVVDNMALREELRRLIYLNENGSQGDDQ